MKIANLFSPLTRAIDIYTFSVKGYFDGHPDKKESVVAALHIFLDDTLFKETFGSQDADFYARFCLRNLVKRVAWENSIYSHEAFERIFAGDFNKSYVNAAISKTHAMAERPKISHREALEHN